MAFPVYYPVRESDIKRGIKSPACGGHTFPCSATNPLFGITPWDTIKEAFEKITGGGVGTDDVEYVFTARQATPANGELYLEIGEVNCRAAGVTAITATLLTGLSVRVDAIDGSRNYRFEVIINPSAAVPTVVGTLNLVNAISNQRDDLGTWIPVGTEWGVRVVKTNAAVGRSAFSKMVVAVRLRN